MAATEEDGGTGGRERGGGGGVGHTVKVVVVGDGAVGKTSLLVSFVMDRFPTEHVPTVFANYAKEMKVCGDNVKLWLCDTAGQEEFDRLRVMSYTDTDVFLLCYSVTDPESFHNVSEKWMPEVHFHCPHAQCVLVATKADLLTNDQEISRLAKDGLKTVSTEQGQQLARDLGVEQYQECSALTQDGVEEVFEWAARLALAPPNNRAQHKPHRSKSQRIQQAVAKRCLIV